MRIAQYNDFNKGVRTPNGMTHAQAIEYLYDVMHFDTDVDLRNWARQMVGGILECDYFVMPDGSILIWE